VIPLPDRAARGVGEALELPPAAKATPLEAGLTQIGVADPGFSPEHFI
jgi:hypothetical protein